LSVAIGSGPLMILGLALSLVSGAMLAVWCLVGLSAWSLFVPMAISSVGNGLSQPPAIAAGLSVYPRIAGSASGLLGFLQMMTAALGTWLIGWLPPQSAMSMILVVVASLALALFFGLRALRRPESEPQSAPAAQLARQVARRP